MSASSPGPALARPGVFIGEVTFLPADPPRMSSFALWRPAPGFATEGGLRLILPAHEGVRVIEERVGLLHMRAAIPWLAAGRGQGTRSLLAWRAAVRAGLALVARGRIRPWISPSGHDAWTAGPFDGEDEALLMRLAGAMPAEGHAVPIEGEPSRIVGPATAIRACWDALADALPRTAAATAAFGGPLYGVWEPSWAGRLVPVLVGDGNGRGAAVRLRLELPTEAPPILSGAIDSFNGQVALRRGIRRWSPLAGLLHHSSVELTEDEGGHLLGLATELGNLGIEVVLPEVETAHVRAVVGSDGNADDAVFTLDALLDFRWEVAAGEQPLTAAEVDELAGSGRRLVRLRDRWVRIDPELPQLLHHPRRALGAGEALAAVLTATVEVDGRTLEARAAGALELLRARLAELGGPREEADPPKLEAVLRGYQRRGLAWLSDVCALGVGGCLADDMGLGKTVQVIALHLHRAAGPALVVCPASLLGNWERELRAFAPGLPVRRYHGGGRAMDGLGEREVVLTTYGVVRRDRAALAGVAWDLVVADEAQHIKNPDSTAARELRLVPARARLALTGTPIENRLLDLWSLLDWTTPGLLGPRERFQRRAAEIERGGDEETEARFRQLVRPFLLRRRKSDPGIAPELPPKTETDHLVSLSPEQVGLYEAIVRETLEAISNSEGIQRRGLVLKLVTALKQVCNHPAHYLREEGPLAGRSGKLEALDDLLDVILDEGESVLVFTQYARMGRLLERHLSGRCRTEFLHGRASTGARERMVERFQSGEVPVFLISLRAGGFGLNLARATHVIHFDRWWNPAVEDQASDRAHRIGQERPVQIHRLVSEGTLEERIAGLLGRKRDLAERVIGGGESWIGELSDRELAELVGLRTAS